MQRGLTILGVILIGALSLWFLPMAVDSWLIAACIALGLIGTTLWGLRYHRWRAAVLLATCVGIADLFAIVRFMPQSLWIIILALWAGGTWFVGHIDTHQSRIFHQALASFLVVELFIILMLWPINILSKSVITVSFGLLLWNEFVRVAPVRQRIQESVAPFLLIITLMTLTGRWL